MTDALNWQFVVAGHDTRTVQPIGIAPELFAIDAQQANKKILVCLRQITNGVDAVPAQFLFSRSSDIQQIRCRQRPYLLPEGVRSDLRNGVGLFHIGAKLCKNLVEADSYGYSQAHLCLYGFTDLVCNLDGGAVLQKR